MTYNRMYKDIFSVIRQSEENLSYEKSRTRLVNVLPAISISMKAFQECSYGIGFEAPVDRYVSLTSLRFYASGPFDQ